VGNLSMWNHPIHLHGVQFEVTGSDGGRWPQNQWRKEVTEIVGVGQTRDLEFIAVPGDWAFHCHMSHHTMNAMGHEVPNMLGVKQPEAQINKVLPGYMAMGESGMAEHQLHTDMGHMPGPENTLPMMMGEGRYGKLEMGGMFSMIRVRDELGDQADFYEAPTGTQARKVSEVPPGIPV
jgi:manganese oxidase